MLTLYDAKTAFVRKATARLRRYAMMCKLCCSAVYGYYALRAGFWRDIMSVFVRRKKYERQRPLTWAVPFPDFSSPAELTTWLESRGIRYSEGSNVVYIPPQDQLKALIPTIVEFYPRNSGFKILVLRHSQDLLFSLGASRFSLAGADLDPTYPLERDIPDRLQTDLTESVVFYLSVRQHIGLLQSLRRIPWRALVYEGHQREHVRNVPDILAPLLSVGVRRVATSRLADGDSGSRPIAILVGDR